MCTEIRIIDAEAHVFQPGDRVLLIMSDKHVISDEEHQRWQHALHEKFPDIIFMLAGGVQEVHVEHQPPPSGWELEQAIIRIMPKLKRMGILW